MINRSRSTKNGASFTALLKVRQELREGSYTSIELNTSIPVPGRQKVMIMMDDAYFN